MTLQTSSPYPLKCFSVWSSDRARKIEREAHIHFKDKRLSGEWFSISVEEAETFLRMKRAVPNYIMLVPYWYDKAKTPPRNKMS